MSSKVYSFKERLMLDAFNMNQGMQEAKNDTKMMRIVNTIYGFAIALVLGGRTAFAQIQIIEQFKNMLGDVYSAIDGLITAVTAVAIGVAIIMYIISNNPQKVEAAKTWGIRAFIGLIVFKLLGFFFADSNTLTEGAPTISW